MALLLCSNAFANDEVEVSQVTFEQFIIPYFEEYNNTQVFDHAGNNITQEFFAKNTPYYLAGDFDSIKKYSYAKVGIFKASKERFVSTRGFNETRYIESYEASYINYSNGSAHASGYVKTTIGGTYVYDPNSGMIASAYNPVVKRVEFEDFREWKMSYKNLTTRASISPDKFYAIFSATMTITGKYEYGGITWNENMGAITATVRGDASGVK